MDAKLGNDFSGFGGGGRRVFSSGGQGSLAGDLGELHFQGSSLGDDFASSLAGMGGAGAFQSLETAALPYGDPCWVTVFGFPGRATSLVRQQLEALCGPILEIRHGDGNFMHVHFHSAAAGNMCLAQNGRAILGGKLLIGCVPCTSGLVGAGQGMDESEEAETHLRPAGQSSVVGLPWALSTGPDPGPKVTRGGFFQRVLDMLFDI